MKIFARRTSRSTIHIQILKVFTGISMRSGRIADINDTVSTGSSRIADLKIFTRTNRMKVDASIITRSTGIADLNIFSISTSNRKIGTIIDMVRSSMIGRNS
ncbi:unnamed protein product [Meloidogyne enterolobii]|uniref:Uncharacterized protein n=1 Tax=Meloidogyne enterolobii TaxID=390850 RepID=A0ACB1A8B1_MELEN